MRRPIIWGHRRVGNILDAGLDYRYVIQRDGYHSHRSKSTLPPRGSDFYRGEFLDLNQ